MLVTDPKQRASLQEIMLHPWMTKGFGAAPENYLPPREPLQLPLDPLVVQAMTGFDFGSPETIQSQLTEVLESPDYNRAVKLALSERKNQAAPHQHEMEKKRGVFDFYKRRNSANSRDTLTGGSSKEALALGVDPINAFHPLISVYYLVREKQDRDRLLANPGATSMPRVPGEAPLQIPDLVAPKAAHTNAGAYEMPGEKPTGGRSRPRARTHGEDEISTGMQHLKIPSASGPNGPPSPAIIEPPPDPHHHSRKESAASSLLRRFSTRRKKEPSERSHPPMVHVQSPHEQSTLRKSFSVRRTRERESSDGPPSSMLRSGSSQPQHSDLLSPTRHSESQPRTSKLGRSASVSSAEFRRKENRRGASEQPPPSPRVTYNEPPQVTETERSAADDAPSRASEQQTGHLNPRSATMRAKSLGHARRESIQARRARREEAREANLPEETGGELGNTSGMSNDRVDREGENVKPVFLKGLFSVSTTSTKPVSVICADIIRVLRQLNVEYSEIKGGFNCRRTPSIDLKKVVDLPPSSHGDHTPGHRRRISFGGFLGGSAEREREDFRDAERSPQTPRTPARRGDNSYTNSDASDESVSRDQHRGGSSARAVGETSTHVQSELGGSMILEFEIFIVKVPLLSLHGIQFKRLAGGTWQYKNMADQILRELRL